MFEAARRWWWLVSAGVVLIVVSVFILWPRSEEPRGRQYRDVSACLLTDAGGITTDGVKPVWAGMQDASLKTLGQVRFLAITGQQSVANARAFVSTLALGRCAVIVAAGKLPVDAVLAVARENPGQKFVIVVADSSTSAPASDDVSVITGSDDDATRMAVSSAVAEMLGGP